MTSTSTEAPATYVGSCHSCKTFVRTTEVRNIDWYAHKTWRASAWCPSCPSGTGVTVFIIQGRLTATPCNEKCTDAKGVKCDCQCAGKNHGATA